MKDIDSQRFYRPADVAVLLGVGRNKAYNIVAMLNKELAGKGYITERGKVSRKYFHQRFAV